MLQSPDVMIVCWGHVPNTRHSRWGLVLSGGLTHMQDPCKEEAPQAGGPQRHHAGHQQLMGATAAPRQRQPRQSEVRQGTSEVVQLVSLHKEEDNMTGSWSQPILAHSTTDGEKGLRGQLEGGTASSGLPHLRALW
jgi:hypothetical protein